MNKIEEFNASPKDAKLKIEEEQRFSQPELMEKIEIPQNMEQRTPNIEKTPAEFKRMEEIRSQLKETAVANQLNTQSLKSAEPAHIENQQIVVRNGKQIKVQYVSKESIYPAYGYGDGDTATVREDLPKRVKNFVKEHELYHCTDQATWGGWLGKEIRANVMPGLKDPIGLAATVWKTITDIDRIKLYLKRFKDGN